MTTANKPPLELPPGKRVKWLRDRAGEKQRELALAIGVDADTVAKIEGLKGMPREMNRIQAIGEHYGIPWQWLIEAMHPRKKA
jgi:transcriptional regulator with XRE-family HTH domain